MDLQQARDGSLRGSAPSLRAANRMRRARSCSSTVRTVCGLTWTVSTLRIWSSEQSPASIAVTPELSASVSSVRLPVPISNSTSGQRRRASMKRPIDRAKPKWIGSRTGSAMNGYAGPLGSLDGAPERIEIAGNGRDQHRRRRVIEGQRQRVLVEAEKIVRARPARRSLSSSRLAESTLTENPSRLQFPHRLAKQRKRRFRQAAEVDDVGAGAGKRPRPRHQRVDRKHRRVDDLGEDAHVVAGKVRAARRPGRERPAGRRSRRGRERRARRNAPTAARGRRDSGRAG